MLYFTNTFNNIVNKHALLRQKRIRRQYQSQWFNQEILLAVALRDYLKRDWDEDRYKKQRNQVLQMIKTAKSNFYNRAIYECKGNSHILWQVVKQVTSKSKKPSIPTAIKLDNCQVNDGQNIANCFNTYFANIANSLSDNHKVHSQYRPSQKFLSFI